MSAERAAIARVVLKLAAAEGLRCSPRLMSEDEQQIFWDLTRDGLAMMWGGNARLTDRGQILAVELVKAAAASLLLRLLTSGGWVAAEDLDQETKLIARRLRDEERLLVTHFHGDVGGFRLTERGKAKAQELATAAKTGAR